MSFTLQKQFSSLSENDDPYHIVVNMTYKKRYTDIKI